MSCFCSCILRFVLPSLPHTSHGDALPPSSSSAADIGNPVSMWRRRRGVATSEFRRDIYRRGLWVIPESLNDVTGRVRETSPEWYRTNLAQTHRLVPWLNRETNALLGDARQTPSSGVVDEIIDLVQRHEIRSPEFHARLQRLFGANTPHFQHEFFYFARSVYDMVGFDNNARYTERVPVPERPPPAPIDPGTVVISSSDSSSSDDGIEVVGVVRNPNQPSSSTLNPSSLTTGASIGASSSSALNLPSDLAEAGPSNMSDSDLTARIRERLNRHKTLTPMLASLISPFLVPSVEVPTLPPPPASPDADPYQPSTSNGNPSANFSHLVIPDSSSSDDSTNAVEVVGIVPPRHQRPPMAIIDIVSSEESIASPERRNENSNKDDAEAEKNKGSVPAKSREDKKCASSSLSSPPSTASERRRRTRSHRRTAEDRIRSQRRRNSSSSSPSPSPSKSLERRARKRRREAGRDEEHGPSAGEGPPRPKQVKGKGKGKGKGKSNRHLASPTPDQPPSRQDERDQQSRDKEERKRHRRDGQKKQKKERHRSRSPSRRKTKKKAKAKAKKSKRVMSSDEAGSTSSFNGSTDREKEKNSKKKKPLQKDEENGYDSTPVARERETATGSTSSSTTSLPPPQPSAGRERDTSEEDDDKPLATRWFQSGVEVARRRRRVVLPPTETLNNEEQAEEEQPKDGERPSKIEIEEDDQPRQLPPLSGPAMDRTPWEEHNLADISKSDLRHKLIGNKQDRH